MVKSPIQKSRKQYKFFEDKIIIDGKFSIKSIILEQSTNFRVCICFGPDEEILSSTIYSRSIYESTLFQTEKKLINALLFKQVIKDKAKRMINLDHHNILNYRYFSLQQDDFYLIHEYCQNGKLKNIVKAGKLQYEFSLQIIHQIIKGLTYLHQKKIYHLLLNLDSINLHNGQVKIMDLQPVLYLKQSNPDLIFKFGTSQFMAPEVEMNKESGPKSDIWSLGVILYCLLYGNLPWQLQGSHKEWLVAKKRMISHPPEVYVPNWVKFVLEKMISFNPEERPSLKELSNSLKK